jgi:hypothetical protein
MIWVRPRGLPEADVALGPTRKQVGATRSAGKVRGLARRIIPLLLTLVFSFVCL